MEAAAEKIRQLSQTVLPQFPHQLSLDHTWKCRNLPGSDRCEEWHVRPLQYMTLVSVADRGLLITRGYSDVRPDPDPPKPLPKEVNALAKSGGEKKKLSLSDYMNKKSGATVSASPPESGSLPAVRKEHERSASANTAADSRATPRESRKPDTARNSAEPSNMGKPHAEVRDGPRPSKLPPKPASLPPRPPTPDSSKKRVGDGDDPRNIKRPKAADAAHRLAEDHSRSQTPREEARRRKEAPLPLDAPKDGRSGSSSLVNGRGAQKPIHTARATSPLPSGRSRGSSINGSKPADSARAVSSRSDASQKLAVPPLLSPLNFELEGNGDRPAQKPEKRRHDDSIEVAKPIKASSKQDLGGPIRKVTKLPSRPSLPALLSPTLPPEVEAELERAELEKTKQLPPKPLDDSRRESYLFTFKVPKRLRQDMRRILAITSSRKEPQRPSSSSGTGQQAPSRKRPASGDKDLPETQASKKPRVAEVSKSVHPSTPSKKTKNTTAMSRVSSSNSTSQTPGDAITSTPSRIAINGEPRSAADQSRIEKLREKETAFVSLGKRLKRHGDLAMKGRTDLATNGSSINGRVESAVISGYISITESIVAFMSAFDAQDTHRSLAGRGLDPHIWISLLPLLDFLLKDISRYDSRRLRPLAALLSSIQGIAYDHIITNYALCDNPSTLNQLPDAAGQVRRRNRAWQVARDNREGIESRLLIDVQPWHGVDETIDMVLTVMQRWCDGENIDWTPEVSSPRRERLRE